MPVASANTYTASIQVTDPELSEDEERQVDRAVEDDLELWRELKHGRSEEMVQGVGNDSD
jgi:hypothetical protein